MENELTVSSQLAASAMSAISEGAKINKRKLKLIWTCSDFVCHEHRWYWSAWLCGRVQYILNRIGR